MPCTVCNREVKFGSLLARARAWDAVAVATGHYARITHDPATGRHLLWRGVDTQKDQSDFLWPLSQSQLGAARFPVGDLTKAEVRDRARALGLVTADKPESQEICFIPDDDYRGYLRRRIPQAFRPGPIEDGGGRVLGQHEGLAAFTVGQRRGLGLATGRTLYVTALDPARNTVVVGEAREVEVDAFVAEQVNWIAIQGIEGPLEVTAQIRHRHTPAPATIRPCGQGVLVRFEAPQWAPAPGQSVVFYQGDLVVGGGVIAARSHEAA
jgi:tRNA-specific 2-thiouridylase